MDQIQHKFVDIGGLNLHVADIGTGPNVVVFLHGFPEIWYSWRHQIIALAAAGFRAIAPDYRGYGLSDPPPEPDKTSFSVITNDIILMLDSLGLSKVFVVAKDFGARPAFLLALLHPERILGVITLGVPYRPPAPSQFHKLLPQGFYISRWKEPGRAEADFGRFDTKTVLKNIYILFSRSEIPMAEENQEIMDLVDPSTPLPPWFSEEDLAAYSALYDKSGFPNALQLPYRSSGEEYNIEDPIAKVPALLIMGGKDYFLKFPGIEDLIKSEKVKEFAPNLETAFIPEGTHFVQEQFPELVNQLIIEFLRKQAASCQNAQNSYINTHNEPPFSVSSVGESESPIDFSQSHKILNMDQIQHKFVDVGGLNLHVAEIGTGPNVVVCLHGFPEIWYSWRHQMIALAGAGFRVIAPDYRGYGLSDPPPDPEKASFSYFVSDILALLDALDLAKVFIVGKDFGVRVGYLFATLHPERVSGIITFGAPYVPRSSFQFHKHFPEGLYILRFQEPGRAEADFGRLDAKTVVRNIYILFSRSETPVAEKNQEIMDLVDPSTPLPPWFSEEDLAAYGALYEKSGFQTALKVPYRSLGEEFNLPDPIVKVPALVIVGGMDYSLKFTGVEDLIKSGKAKEYVPNLEITFVPEGTHFVQEQFPERVNQLILDFLGKHT